jgi:hypothetical protein
MAEHDHRHQPQGGHATGAAHAVSPGPAFSLLRLSLTARLAIAVALTTLVWIAVYWAET